MILRITAVAMFLVFLMAIVVQYNDPDPFFWMLLYAVPAAFSAAAVFHRTTALAFFAALAYVVLALVYGPNWHNVNRTIFVPHLEMMGDDIERARESIGLLIAAAWMGALGVSALAKTRSQKSINPDPSATST